MWAFIWSIYNVSVDAVFKSAINNGRKLSDKIKPTETYLQFWNSVLTMVQLTFLVKSMTCSCMLSLHNDYMNDSVVFL